VTLKRSPKSELLAQLRRGDRATIQVEEAALILEVGRNQAYQAVQRGDIPSLSMGRRRLVPVQPFLRMLDGGLC